MTEKEEINVLLFKLLLPRELFAYFIITNMLEINKEVHIYLEETDKKPEGYENEKLLSKGFHEESIIQDFPLRGKPVFLHVKRRRWQVESTKEVISRDWQTVAKGTRLTSDFATFLKGLLG